MQKACAVGNNALSTLDALSSTSTKLRHLCYYVSKSHSLPLLPLTTLANERHCRIKPVHTFSSLPHFQTINERTTVHDWWRPILNVIQKSYSRPTTRHGGAWGERRYISYSFSTSAPGGGECQRHALAAL
jgi:hypothetical protein